MRKALLAIAFAAPAAWACGVCVEDKVAATYDHAVLQKAQASGKVVVFCELSGPLDKPRITRAAAHVRGLDPASLRVSANPGALSFALDTNAQSPQAAVAAIQQRAAHGTRLTILRLVGAKP